MSQISVTSRRFYQLCIRSILSMEAWGRRRTGAGPASSGWSRGKRLISASRLSQVNLIRYLKQALLS